MSTVLNGVHFLCVFYLEFMSKTVFLAFKINLNLNLFSRAFELRECDLSIICSFSKSYFLTYQCQKFTVQCLTKGVLIGTLQLVLWLFKCFLTYLTVTFCLVQVPCEFLMMSCRALTFLDSRYVASAVS